jgi:hypothetical protein
MIGQEEPYVEETPTPSDGSQPEDQTSNIAGQPVQNVQNDRNVSGQQSTRWRDS